MSVPDDEHNTGVHSVYYGDITGTIRIHYKAMTGTIGRA